MTGWVKIHRDLANHWIAQDMEKLGRWLDLLMYASHKDNKVLMGGRLIEVKRGQMIASCDFLAKRWRCSKSTAATFLELLESDNMIERCTERKITRLTICNYESYQQRENDASDDVPNDTQYDSRTIAERCPNELKNVKECKEIYNNNSSARTREEKMPWNETRERGFVEAFKQSGQIMALARNCRLNIQEICDYLERYMNDRHVIDLGHNDSRHFATAFKRFVEEEQQKPKQAEAQQPKVIEGKAIFNLYK